MSDHSLSGVAVGTRLAGVGNTLALHDVGAEVVAPHARTPEPGGVLPEKQGRHGVRFDWRRALMALRPDVAALTIRCRPWP